MILTRISMVTHTEDQPQDRPQQPPLEPQQDHSPQQRDSQLHSRHLTDSQPRDTQQTDMQQNHQTQLSTLLMLHSQMVCVKPHPSWPQRPHQTQQFCLKSPTMLPNSSTINSSSSE